MKKRRIISMMLAGAMMTGVIVGTAGCGQEANLGETEVGVYETKIASNLIVALHEKLVTLHKGDIYAIHVDMGYGEMASTNKLKFKCGKEYVTDRFVAYSQVKPEDTAYDSVCDGCFELVD